MIKLVSLKAICSRRCSQLDADLLGPDAGDLDIYSSRFLTHQVLDLNDLLGSNACIVTSVNVFVKRGGSFVTSFFYLYVVN